MSTEQTPAMREALRIYRVVLIVKLALLVLTSLTAWGLGGTARFGLFLRVAPTLLLVILVLPPWLEQVLGRYFLAFAVGLDLFFDSVQSADIFYDQRAFWMGRLGLEGVTGPPWPFALKSSDAKTSGGRRMIRARARAGTAPDRIDIASGIFRRLAPGSARRL